jgi:hypothetical protein
MHGKSVDNLPQALSLGVVKQQVEANIHWAYGGSSRLLGLICQQQDHLRADAIQQMVHLLRNLRVELFQGHAWCHFLLLVLGVNEVPVPAAAHNDFS